MANGIPLTPFQAVDQTLGLPAAQDNPQSPWTARNPSQSPSAFEANFGKLTESVLKGVTVSKLSDNALVSRLDSIEKTLRSRLPEKPVDAGGIRDLAANMSEVKTNAESRTGKGKPAEGLSDIKTREVLERIARNLEPISKAVDEFSKKMNAGIDKLSKSVESKRETEAKEKSPTEKIADRIEEEKLKYQTLKSDNWITNFKGRLDESLDKMAFGLASKVTGSLGDVAGRMSGGRLGGSLKSVSGMADIHKTVIDLQQQDRAETLKSFTTRKEEGGDEDPSEMELVEKPGSAASRTETLQDVVQTGFDRVVERMDSAGSTETTSPPPPPPAPVVETEPTAMEGTVTSPSSLGGQVMEGTAASPSPLGGQVMAAIEPSTVEAVAAAAVPETAAIPEAGVTVDRLVAEDAPSVADSIREDILAGLPDDVFELGDKGGAEIESSAEPVMKAPAAEPVEPVEPVVEKSESGAGMAAESKGFIERAVEAFKVFTGEMSKIKGDIAPNIEKLTVLMRGSKVEMGVGAASTATETPVETAEKASAAESMAETQERSVSILDDMLESQEKGNVQDEEHRRKVLKFHENEIKTGKDIASTLVLTNKHLNSMEDVMTDAEEAAKLREADSKKEKDEGVRVVEKESKIPQAEAPGQEDGGVGGQVMDMVKDRLMEKGLGKLGRGARGLGRGVSRGAGRLLGGAKGTAGRIGGRLAGRLGMQAAGRALGVLGPVGAVAATAYGGYQAGQYIGGKLEEWKPGDLQGKTAWERASAGDIMAGATPIGQLGRMTGLMATNEDIYQKQKKDKEEMEKVSSKTKSGMKAEAGSEEKIGAQTVLKRHMLYEKLSISDPKEQDRLDALKDEEFNKEIKVKYGTGWFGEKKKVMDELTAYETSVDVMKKKQAEMAAAKPVAAEPGVESAPAGKVEAAVVKETPAAAVAVPAAGAVVEAAPETKTVPSETPESVKISAAADESRQVGDKMAAAAQEQQKALKDQARILESINNGIQAFSVKEPVQMVTTVDSSYKVPYNQPPYAMNTVFNTF